MPDLQGARLDINILAVDYLVNILAIKSSSNENFILVHCFFSKLFIKVLREYQSQDIFVHGNEINFVKLKLNLNFSNVQDLNSAANKYEYNRK